MMTLLLMVFGRTKNTRSSFCWAPAGQLLGPKASVPCLLTWKSCLPLHYLMLAFPSTLTSGALRRKMIRMDPRSPCPQKVLKVIHTSPGRWGRKGPKLYGFVGYRNPSSTLPSPMEERALNPADGVWCFSVGKESWRNLVRRTSGLIQCAVVVASISDCIIRTDVLHSSHVRRGFHVQELLPTEKSFPSHRLLDGTTKSILLLFLNE